MSRSPPGSVLLRDRSSVSAPRGVDPSEEGAPDARPTDQPRRHRHPRPGPRPAWARRTTARPRPPASAVGAGDGRGPGPMTAAKKGRRGGKGGGKDLVVHGADLSHHNADPALIKARDAGLKFVYHKATEGTTVRDPKYPARR